MIDRKELVGQFLDIFEDYLDRKGLGDTKNQVKLTGADYEWIADRVESTLIAWGLIPGEGPEK